MRMKTLALLSLASLAMLALFAGCDLFSPFSLDDALGEWEAATGTIKGVPATSIHLSVMSNGTMYDAGWDSGDDHYWYPCNGTTAKNVFTGTYYDQAITITLSLKNGKLSAKFAGAGPLDGVTFTDLTKQN